MKRIIYIGGFELPDKNAAAHRVINNGKLFKSLGYEITYIDLSKEQININTCKYINDCQWYSLKYPESIDQWLSFLVSINYLKKLINNYNDIEMIIAYNYPALATYRLLKFCQNKNIKLVADCSEWSINNHHNQLFRIIKNLDTNLRIRILNKKLDGIIVISKFLQNYYQNMHSLYLPPLVDITDIKWQVTKQNKSNVINFLYTGDPGYKDRLDLIIASLIKSNLCFKLTIIGIELNKLVKFYPQLNEINDNRIIIIGKVSHQEAIIYLKQSDYSIFFRHDTIVSKAGFPTKFVEALTLNVPVITNSSSDLEDYLDKKYLINSLDIAQEIRRIVALDYHYQDTTIFNFLNYQEAALNWFEKMS